MMRWLLMVWVVAFILNLMIIWIHELLVSKFQPEEKGKGHARDTFMVILISMIPVFNIFLFFKILHNIATYKYPKDKE